MRSQLTKPAVSLKQTGQLHSIYMCIYKIRKMKLLRSPIFDSRNRRDTYNNSLTKSEKDIIGIQKEIRGKTNDK